MPILNWLTRDEDIRAASRAPYRLLQEAPTLSSGDRESENMLLQGDNLEALKALLPFYAGRVKCIYIDPPYNTGAAFEHYDDNLEHTQWLAMMWPRLELLRELLADNGSIWVNIDDNEGHYLRVIMDEIFGRKNFLCDIAWEKRYSPPPDTSDFGYVHDHILVYRKSKEFRRNLLPLTEDQSGRYKNPDGDPRGPWKAADYTCRYTADERPNLYYPIRQPITGMNIWPKRTRVWAMSQEIHERNEHEQRIWWGTKGTNSVPALKNFFSEINQGMMPMSVWKHSLAGHTQEAMKEMLALFGDDVFPTPKPERLIRTILSIATDRDDLVLDSFLGSGTTAAVAHKMDRRYIGIEMGEHAVTHCVPRLNKVIAGEQGGVSKSVGWEGGDGFRFYRLGPQVFDENGRIQRDIRFPVMAAHVWFSETGRPWTGEGVSPLLGLHDEHAYALLYNGILGDKRVSGGNVLTHATLRTIRQALGENHPGFNGPLTVYGEQSRLTKATLERERIFFKHTPYEVKARD